MFLTFKTWCSHLFSRKRVSRMVIITSNKTQYLVVFLHNLDVDWIPSIFSPRSCRRSSRKCGSSRRAFARWQTRPAAPAARRDIFLSKFRKLCKFHQISAIIFCDIFFNNVKSNEISPKLNENALKNRES